MKKYRPTKITVKTREIVSLVKNAAGENHISVCPVCYAPASASLPAAGINVEYLRFGPAGTHGGKGGYINDRELKVSGHRWQPEGIDVNDITCEASPNQAVEALKCNSFADMKETVYIARMKSDNPGLFKAAAIESVKGDDSGSWTEDGRWLLFRNYFFNVETFEKKEVRNLPGEVDKYFIAASPDLETIIYRDGCYDFVRNESGEVVNMDEYSKHFDKYQERQKTASRLFGWLKRKRAK